MKMQVMAYDRGPLILSDSISKDLLNSFECLVQAGYHIFRYYAFHDTRYTAYCVRKEPFMRNAQEVFSFEDRID